MYGNAPVLVLARHADVPVPLSLRAPASPFRLGKSAWPAPAPDRFAPPSRPWATAFARTSGATQSKMLWGGGRLMGAPRGSDARFHAFPRLPACIPGMCRSTRPILSATFPLRRWLPSFTIIRARRASFSILTTTAKVGVLRGGKRPGQAGRFPYHCASAACGVGSATLQP